MRRPFCVGGSPLTVPTDAVRSAQEAFRSAQEAFQAAQATFRSAQATFRSAQATVAADAFAAGGGGAVLRCSDCRHPLGVRVPSGSVVVLRQLGEGACTAVGAIDAISCDQTFANGHRCRGGWVDPERVEDVRAVVTDPDVLSLAPVFAAALAKAG